MYLKRTIGYAVMVCGLSFYCQTPDASGEDWFKKGVAQIEENRFDAAIESFTRVIELIPHDYEAYNNRGIAYTRRGESYLGELDFSRALKHNPQFYSAFLNRGLARQEQGAYASALLDYLEAHQLKPDRKRPRLLIAWILAACPDNHLRDGTLALHITQTLSDHQQNSRPALSAAAHAADGNFQMAVALQKRHLDEMHIEGADAGRVAPQQNALELYQTNRPLIKGAPASKTLTDSDAHTLLTALEQAMNKVIVPAGRAARVSPKLIDGSSAGPDTLPEKSFQAPVKSKVKRPKGFRVIKRGHQKNPVVKPLPHKRPSLKKPAFLKKRAYNDRREKPDDAATRPSGLQAVSSPGKTEAAQTAKQQGAAIEFSGLKSASQTAPVKTPTAFPYVLVIGSYQNVPKGFATARKYAQQQFPVFTAMSADASGRQWYQIYYGWYPDKKSADDMAATLKQQGFNSPLVRRAPLALQIEPDQTRATDESVETRLAALYLIGYRIENRLLVGAYKDSAHVNSTMAAQLAAAGLTHRMTRR